ncbi:hypothetical protein IW140_006016 [Coemansia sp. RSA 1813]|nr:hypothetical protein EV178_003364 [Coemansia sp. RSA 1646]KAJ1774128.1 hypothetical protein LPJ74_000227 [Coemansia sp. RSA 1843]KAJ2086011.1 hypothetical protein IW138_005967 [Coemansia sp. RSA 986]KAJ2210789.1 hypothetical protein EV179_005989 [Coemansia sp. RSA 487]KAJ2563699.1 hypothetical protein IW140_006016 [Coemansia sp. RSA 1813]
MDSSVDQQPKPEHLAQERLNLMEKKIERRPTREELEEHNVLRKTNVAPALQAKEMELQRSRLEDKLEHKLECRPTREELEQHNVLKKSNVAPALQAKEMELQRSQLEDKLEHMLERRPTADKLKEQHILTAEDEQALGLSKEQ